MKVQFEQSGGFAGAVRRCELDTATLAPEKVRELENLIRGSGIARSGEFLSETARDLQQYEITIEEGKEKSSVIYDDSSIPAAAKPLLGFLKQACKEPIPQSSSELTGRFVRTQKKTCAVGQRVVIEFADKGGNPKAWITLAKASDPPDKFGEWKWTEGRKSGSFSLPGLDVGEYEVRAFFDWRMEPPGYSVSASYAFSVEENAEDFHVKTHQPVYPVQELIEVEFFDPSEGLVVSEIALAKKLDPPGNYGERQKTLGWMSGSLSFDGLAAGEYEVRGYSQANLISVRRSFTVEDIAKSSS